jgi:LytS/YehU family sensor histidine kinase
MRFPKKFAYEIIVAGDIEADDTLIPSMIVQPFVENSIEHGFNGIDYAGHITVGFKKDEHSLRIEINDNGKGLAAAITKTDEHISRASQIIKDRIYLLNLKLKTKASFSINGNKNAAGVAVIITLPLLYKQDIKN